MKGRFGKALALALLAALAALISLGPFSDNSSHAGSSKIHPDVLEALQTRSEVGVIISLQGPEMPLDLATTDDLAANAATRQANALAVLDQDDFTLGSQFEVLAALVGAITPSGAQKLARHPDVAGVHVNEEIFLSLDDSVPLIHADEVHDVGVNGAGIDVAVFDTGIDTDHADLAGSLVEEHCFVYDRVGPRPDLCPGLPGGHPAEDGNGHGTLVSGIVTSDGDNGIAPTGVAPGVRIHAYKVVSDAGSLGGTWGGVLAGIDDILLDHPEEIEFANFSIVSGTHVYGAGECEPPVNPAELLFAPEFWVALQALRINGTVSIAGTGNLFNKDAMGFPACVQSVIAVGAVNDNDVAQNFSNASDDLDLLAPGGGAVDRITSTWPGNTTLDDAGTSYANPHGVGVAALLLEARPDLNPTAPGLTSTQRLIRAETLERWLKLTGTPVKDDLFDSDPSTSRTTPRIDARVALLTDDDADFDLDGLTNGQELDGVQSPKLGLGELFSNPLQADTDLDGCTDGQELGAFETQGGLRDPKNFWDFFDVPTGSFLQRDRVVSGGDITAVVNRFGSNDDGGSAPTNRWSDPLSFPLPFGYHPAYDRGGSIAGLNSWNLLPADGTISGSDIAAVVAQFGHNCVP